MCLALLCNCVGWLFGSIFFPWSGIVGHPTIFFFLDFNEGTSIECTGCQKAPNSAGNSLDCEDTPT